MLVHTHTHTHTRTHTHARTHTHLQVRGLRWLKGPVPIVQEGGDQNQIQSVEQKLLPQSLAQNDAKRGHGPLNGSTFHYFRSYEQGQGFRQVRQVRILESKIESRSS